MRTKSETRMGIAGALLMLVAGLALLIFVFFPLLEAQ